MFEIDYKGGNGIIIATKKTTLVVDPKLDMIGAKNLSAKDAVEVSTEPRFALASPDANLVIDGPGDYEIGDFSLHAVSATRHIDTEKDEKIATIYRIEMGDVRMALLGNIAPTLTDEQLEEIGVVDIVILPVGGGGLTLDPTSAAAIVRQIDPKVVIPTHFADDTLKYEMPQESADVFAKELSAPVEKVTKYKVKGGMSLPATLTIVEIARS